MEEELAGRNYLVTTPIQETWPTNGKIIFLGEWCKIYNRRDDLKNLNHTTLPYHWDNRIKFNNDFNSLNNLYESVLVSLSLTLNKIHKVEFSTKYWRILVGPWLGTFIQVLFDRWEMIEVALNSQTELYSIIIDIEEHNTVPNDMNEFLKCITADNWNHYIYTLILKEMNEIELLKVQYNLINKAKKTKINLFKYFYKLTAKTLTPSNSPFVLSSYLSKKNEFKFSLKNKYIPLWYNLTKPNEYNFSLKKRNFTIKHKAKNEFESFLLKAIPFQIPKIYLEGYMGLKKEVENLGWQKSPKFIFTSNSFWEDDLFKSYAAYQNSIGKPLFIAQHGGNYGIVKQSFSENHQLSISDRFFSWGWTGRNKKIIPLGNIKTTKPLGINHYKSKKILLVTCSLPRYFYFLFNGVLASQWLDYFDDQCQFINTLNHKTKKNTTVRLYSNDYDWNQKQRWKDKFEFLDYDNANEPIIKQLKKTRIFVATYNATTFLESLSMNIPTVIFWNPNYWELREDSIPFFKELERVKIFHKNPKSAAKHINLIYDELETWWNSDDLQRVKALFLHSYSRNEDKLINKLDKAIQNFNKTV